MPISSVEFSNPFYFYKLSSENEKKNTRRLRANKVESVQISLPLPLFVQNYIVDNPLRYKYLATSHLRTPTSIFTNMDYVKTFFIPSTIQQLLNTVSDYQGTMICNFSQNLGAFARERLRHKETALGMCFSLVAHWVIYDSQDLNLFDCLLLNNGNTINKFVMNSLKELEIISCKKGGTYQENKIYNWLQKNGIIKQEAQTQAKEQSLSQNNCENIIKCLDNILPQATYHFIVIWGDFGCSHIFLLKVDNNCITFFDPNIGVISFDNFKNLSSWFSNEFWPKSGYGYICNNFKISVLNKIVTTIN